MGDKEGQRDLIGNEGGLQCDFSLFVVLCAYARLGAFDIKPLANVQLWWN